MSVLWNKAANILQKQAHLLTNVELCCSNQGTESPLRLVGEARSELLAFLLVLVGVAVAEHVLVLRLDVVNLLQRFKGKLELGPGVAKKS